MIFFLSNNIRVIVVSLIFDKQVVEDVVLTINQAIEPVEKGMTKIQETFHEITVRDDEKESEVKVEEHEQDVTIDDTQVSTSEDKVTIESSGRTGS